MLTEATIVDQIEVTRFNTVQVRYMTQVWRSGNLIARSYHRRVLEPGDDLSQEDEKVRAIAAAIWTPGVIEEYLATVRLRALP